MTPLRVIGQRHGVALTSELLIRLGYQWLKTFDKRGASTAKSLANFDKAGIPHVKRR
jgi:hypothetical protein